MAVADVATVSTNATAINLIIASAPLMASDQIGEPDQTLLFARAGREYRHKKPHHRLDGRHYRMFDVTKCRIIKSRLLRLDPCQAFHNLMCWRLKYLGVRKPKMSANGTKQILMPTMSMSAFGGKADMDQPLLTNLDL
jgi:hypothetical protein